MSCNIIPTSYDRTSGILPAANRPESISLTFSDDDLSGGLSIAQSLAPPAVKGGAATSAPDWKALLTTARTRFPDTEFRIIALPAKKGDLISLRTRQQGEWLPNGRSTFWFDPADGRVVEARDAFALLPGMRSFNKTYPLHAATVGGQPFRLLTALMGLVLTLLGTLAVWSFWFRRNTPA